MTTVADRYSVKEQRIRMDLPQARRERILKIGLVVIAAVAMLLMLTGCPLSAVKKATPAGAALDLIEKEIEHKSAEVSTDTEAIKKDSEIQLQDKDTEAGESMDDLYRECIIDWETDHRLTFRDACFHCARRYDQPVQICRSKQEPKERTGGSVRSEPTHGVDYPAGGPLHPIKDYPLPAGHPLHPALH